jgi:hypothetical protein
MTEPRDSHSPVHNPDESETRCPRGLPTQRLKKNQVDGTTGLPLADQVIPSSITLG